MKLIAEPLAKPSASTLNSDGLQANRDRPSIAHESQAKAIKRRLLNLKAIGRRRMKTSV
jgi:hypothetical protein